MRLTIGGLYAEVGYSFDISYQVILKIREELIAKIMKPYGLADLDKHLFLGLNITTGSRTLEVEVKGPDIDKRNGFINYALWLPYDPIVKSDDYLMSFIRYLFDSLALFFSLYSVKEYDIRRIQEVIENEIKDNPEYRQIDSAV